MFLLSDCFPLGCCLLGTFCIHEWGPSSWSCNDNSRSYGGKGVSDGVHGITWLGEIQLNRLGLVVPKPNILRGLRGSPNMNQALHIVGLLGKGVDNLIGCWVATGVEILRSAPSEFVS